MNIFKLTLFIVFPMNLVPSWYHWDRWGLNGIHSLYTVGVDCTGCVADKNPVYFKPLACFPVPLHVAPCINPHVLHNFSLHLSLLPKKRAMLTKHV